MFCSPIIPVVYVPLNEGYVHSDVDESLGTNQIHKFHLVFFVIYAQVETRSKPAAAVWSNSSSSWINLIERASKEEGLKEKMENVSN